MNESSEYADTYRQEAEELLAVIEEAILEVEENPENNAAINRLFRAIHTIKGSGAMFGFDNIAAFTHHVETVLDRVRENIVPVTKELIDLILASCDQIKAMLDAAAGGPAANVEQAGKIIAGLESLSPGVSNADGIALTGVVDTLHAAGNDEGRTAYRVRFRPHPDIFASGMDPALLLDELRALGECTVVAQTEDIPAIDELNSEQCYIFWDIVLTTNRGIDAINDVFIFVNDESEIKINEIASEADVGDVHKRLGEILVERGDITADIINEALGAQKQIGELLVEAGVVTQGRVESALTEQQVIKRRKSAAMAASVRVPADRLDNLINLVGELVITQARLTQVSAGIDRVELAGPVEEVERLSGELRDCVLDIRMLPIGTTFSKFRRLVRDLSAELGKDIALVTEGAETELDKTVIERLDDPLVHLIRNSIDHGIESPEERRAANKSQQGRIRLSAAHKGANVVITIEDDGKGLDVEAIKSRAVERGLIEQDAEMSESEIFDLIFVPGFSTAERVTSVSGRGVGMDVVKRKIDALRGSIEITSEKTKGTTITLALPLTLAIIDGLLVEAGEDRFVLPLSLVEECVELRKTDITNAHGRHMIPVRGELIPYVRLSEIFAITCNKPSIEQIAIVHVDGLRVGIVVDKVIGEHQTVIKSLGKMYKDTEGISGATIMGDGRVALIVDVPKIIRCAEREE
jgi:two-component system chemotaxis sensor kinase CheA